MSGACSMCEEKINTYRSFVKKPEEIRTLGNLGVNEKLSKCDGRAWIGLMWLKIRVSGELLCKWS
jgi:hypothetical protein